MRTKQGSESLDFAFEAGTADLQVVSLGLDVLEFCLETTHLVDALLSIASSSHCVSFALLDARGVGC